jgi:hypothetical protein
MDNEALFMGSSIDAHCESWTTTTTATDIDCSHEQHHHHHMSISDSIEIQTSLPINSDHQSLEDLSSYTDFDSQFFRNNSIKCEDDILSITESTEKLTIQNGTSSSHKTPKSSKKSKSKTKPIDEELKIEMMPNISSMQNTTFSDNVMNLLHYSVAKKLKSKSDMQNMRERIDQNVKAFSERVMKALSQNNTDVTLLLNMYQRYFEVYVTFIDMIYKKKSDVSTRPMSESDIKMLAEKAKERIMNDNGLVEQLHKIHQHARELSAIKQTWKTFNKTLLAIIYEIRQNDNYASSVLKQYHMLKQGTKIQNQALVILEYNLNKLVKFMTSVLSNHRGISENINSDISNVSNENKKIKGDIFDAYKASVLYCKDMLVSDSLPSIKLISSSSNSIDESISEKSTNINYISDYCNKISNALCPDSVEVKQSVHSIMISLINFSENNHSSLKIDSKANQKTALKDYKEKTKPHFTNVHKHISHKNPHSNHKMLIDTWKSVHNKVAKFVAQSKSDLHAIFKNKAIRSHLTQLQSAFDEYHKSTLSNSNAITTNSEVNVNNPICDTTSTAVIHNDSNECDFHSIKHITHELSHNIRNYMKNDFQFENLDHVKEIASEMSMIISSNYANKNNANHSNTVHQNKRTNLKAFDENKINKMNREEKHDFEQSYYTLEGVLKKITSSENDISVDAWYDFFRGGSLEDLIYEFCLSFTVLESEEAVFIEAKQVAAQVILAMTDRNAVVAYFSKNKQVNVDKYASLITIGLLLFKFTKDKYPNIQVSDQAIQTLGGGADLSSISNKLESIPILGSLSQKQKSNLAARIYGLIGQFEEKKYTKSVVLGTINTIVNQVIKKVQNQKKVPVLTAITNLARLGMGIVIECLNFDDLKNVVTEQSKNDAVQKVRVYFRK